MREVWQETFMGQEAMRTLEYKGKFLAIEPAPARVCLETSERFFAPETVEQLQQIVWERKSPVRVIETPRIRVRLTSPIPRAISCRSYQG